MSLYPSLATLRDFVVKKTFQKANNPAFSALNPDFEITVLGGRSGVVDGNLSAYMVRPINGTDALLCDTGTLGHGLKHAEKNGAFDHLPLSNSTTQEEASKSGQVLHHMIKAYLISHAHLDHVAGLVLASPDDTPKPLLALEETNTLLSDHLFNGRIWGNQTTKGEGATGKYALTTLNPAKETPVENSSFTVKAWPLTHGNTISTAFLLKSGGSEILYCGDTEADDKTKPEQEQRLRNLWHDIAPSIREGRLKAILIEATYSDSRPANALYGHLTPNHLLNSLRDLALICGGRHYIRGLKIIITHIKENFSTGEDPSRQIARDLNDGNDMGLCFIIAEQGARYQV